MGGAYTMADDADFYVQNNSTQIKVVDSSGNIALNNGLYTKSTAGHVIFDSSGNLLLGSSAKGFTQSTGSTDTLFDSSGQLYYRGRDISAIQEIEQGVGASTTFGTIDGYSNCTIIKGTSGQTYMISAPAYAGMKKKLIFPGPLDATTITAIVLQTSSTCAFFGSTVEAGVQGATAATLNTSAFSSNMAQPMIVELWAPTSGLWQVMDANSKEEPILAVTFTT